MRVGHYIIMSSAYTEGTRIALDITWTDQFDNKAIKVILKNIKQCCGEDVPLSTHFIQTESTTWESVVKYDPYFKGVRCVDSEPEFSETVNKSRTLLGTDVADYILSKVPCTHLSLEKLVYFAYADYLCEHSKRLFEDQIFAFVHGPVVDSVYKTYRRSGSQHLQPTGPEKDSDVQANADEMPARSRILFARDGIEKLVSINKTIEKYGGFTPGTLVSLTHRDGSPWSRVDHSQPYQVVPDELIAKYHSVECL